MMKSLNHAISGSCLLEFTEKAHALRHLVYFGVIDVSTVEQVLTKKASRCANPQILVENLKFGLTFFFWDFIQYPMILFIVCSLDEVIFVAEQVNLADPRAEDQDEFFFERRKLLLEAENQQVGW